MKEIVCIAPDGSLELWRLETFPVGRWWRRLLIRGGYWDVWLSVDDRVDEWSLPPEYWGRERLGEL